MPDGGAVSGPLIADMFIGEMLAAEFGGMMLAGELGGAALVGEGLGAAGAFEAGGWAGSGLAGLDAGVGAAGAWAGTGIAAGETAGSYGAIAAAEDAFIGSQMQALASGAAAGTAGGAYAGSAGGVPVPEPTWTGAQGGFDWSGGVGQETLRGKVNPWNLGQEIWGSTPVQMARTGQSMYSGWKGLQMAEQQQKLAGMALSGSDPWGASGGRANAANALSGALADPAAYYSSPEYKALQQATMRSGAAGGYNGSGNMLTALQNAGSSGRNSYLQTLGGFAGAGLNPATAYATSGGLMNNAADLTSRSLASLAYPTGMNSASTNGIPPQLLAALLSRQGATA